MEFSNDVEKYEIEVTQNNPLFYSAQLVHIQWNEGNVMFYKILTEITESEDL